MINISCTYVAMSMAEGTTESVDVTYLSVVILHLASSYTTSRLSKYIVICHHISFTIAFSMFKFSPWDLCSILFPISTAWILPGLMLEGLLGFKGASPREEGTYWLGAEAGAETGRGGAG